MTAPVATTVEGAPATTADEGDIKQLPEEHSTSQDSQVTEELLVEEISIDGMCGVY